jgi:aminopeptidase N
MEFSALVFVSTNWFYQFRGGYDNYLTVITVHEISHQWWYARVGNDAAHAPWLDEALATYSEYVYYEEYHPTLKDWWWSFRVGWYAPQGFVDSTIYEFVTPRDYINAVYLRGVQMLQNIRNDIGTQAFFRLLEEYARAADGRIGTPRLFWSLLSPEQYAATTNTRGQFLRLPQILEAAGSPTPAP